MSKRRTTKHLRQFTQTPMTRLLDSKSTRSAKREEMLTRKRLRRTCQKFKSVCRKELLLMQLKVQLGRMIHR